MKKLLFLAAIIFVVLIIYIFNKDSKIYYLDLSNSKLNYSEYIVNYLNKKLEKYNNGYNNNFMTIIDLINMINDNVDTNIDNKKVTIQNALIKADLVTISVGQDDVASKLSYYNNYSDNEIYNFLDEYVDDLSKLLKVLRKFCKEKIFFLGYHNNSNKEILDKYYKYLNQKVMKLLINYNINYLDLEKISNPEDIGKEIVKCLKNTCQI